MLDDTIVAVSTPPGRGALASVRVSGSSAIDIVDPHFRGFRGGLADASGYTLHPGAFVSSGENVDSVVIGVFRAPHSYTGEDTVEISGHGNPVVIERILRDLVRAGARAAEPGEFTRRAFLNGKIDLAQADAVAALIEARSETAARVALRQLDGSLSHRLQETRDGLVHGMALLEAVIDFPEQDLEPLDVDAVSRHVAEGLRATGALIEACDRGRRVAAQPTLVLIGVPNVGKSSIFNALLRRERAIVHGTPGTTRDVVDAELDLGGHSIRIVDTAGMIDTDDTVEAEGVRRSRREIGHADLVVLVLDATRPDMSAAERELFLSLDPRRVVALFNKIDLVGDIESLPTVLAVDDDRAVDAWPVSAKTGAGVSAVETAIRRAVGHRDLDAADVVIVGEWQRDRMEVARSSLEETTKLMDAPSPRVELVAEELRTAVNALGSLLGLRVGEELLDVIFGSFCIGK